MDGELSNVEKTEIVEEIENSVSALRSALLKGNKGYQDD